MSQIKIDNKRGLGNFCNYYSNENGSITEYQNFSTALDYLASNECNIKINYASIFSVLANNYMVGDATIIHEINRVPWLSTLNKDKVDYHAIPHHGKATLSIQEIGEKLFELLKNEIKQAVGDSKKIGLLLSGGMDSRFVAGVLQDLIKTNSVSVDKVVAYTWGEKNSRDYVYAKTIANGLGWEFQHYLIRDKELWDNIETAAIRGCEYSGVHLHAMPIIGKDSENKVDIILAGSYGDSVGRAEYSGIHATNLSNIKESWGKYANLLSRAKCNEEKQSYMPYIDEYRKRFSDREQWQINEIEKQCHYMRRMLNPCMETINEHTPVYQAFTDPSVYGFMWSLDPGLRSDDVYSEMVNKIDPILQEIPWARTGVPFGKKGTLDDFKKSHHLYRTILNKELLGKMESTILTSALFEKNKSIKTLLKEIKKYPKQNFDYLERLSYLSSLAIFHKKYKDVIDYLIKTRLRAGVK